MFRRRVLFGAVALVLGALLFVVASAFVIDRGYGPIAAAIVGGFAFPVAPILWHLIGERGRAKAAAAAAAKPAKGTIKPKPSTLTGTDRYWMRFVAVAIVVLGPMIAVGRFGVVRAALHHGLWFVPETPPDLRGIGAGAPRDFKDQELLLKHVPSDVEAVAVFHDPNAGGNLVAGWVHRHSMVAFEGSILMPGGASLHDKLEESADQLGKLPWFDRIVAAPAPDGTDIFTSEIWKSKVQLPGDGPSAELRRWLAKAPQSAQLVTAYVPKVRGKLLGIAAWLTVGAPAAEPTTVIEARAETGDVVSAFQLYAEANAAFAPASGRSDACRRAIDDTADHTRIVWNGTVITARIEVANETIVDLIGCKVSL
jgi:hypothetical protein